jgi:hypothetical protein
VVLTPGGALTLKHPRLVKIIFPVSALYGLHCIRASNTKQTNQTKNKLDEKYLA